MILNNMYLFPLTTSLHLYTPNLFYDLFTFSFKLYSFLLMACGILKFQYWMNYLVPLSKFHYPSCLFYTQMIN